MELATVKIRWADGTQQKIWVILGHSNYEHTGPVSHEVVADLVISVARASLIAESHLPGQEAVRDLLASHLTAWKNQPDVPVEPIYVGSIGIEVEFPGNRSRSDAPYGPVVGTAAWFRALRMPSLPATP
ncbi:MULTISPECIES: hypothetical protein [Azospirillum]|uniref:Uncharacterized protein n=2 Tax=Azospirillum TaxID=191 RepID=A0ABW8VL04_9PROT|nr:MULTISPECIES: hypothetical protein [Azospirillum]MBP2296583.1 hypothetical protein [Azospirillum rugosum]MDQ0530358.1 hypothetical protein [Azospirillum rugosum]